MRIFLSHSSSDSKLAEEICQSLEKQGESCFIAPRDIRSGYEYAEELVNGIDESDIMLLLLSKQANDSPHVLREVERAVSKNKTIIVYKLEEVILSKSMEYFLMTHQWLDLKPGKSHTEVVEAIKRYSSEHGGAPAREIPVQAEKPSKKKHFAAIIASVLVVSAAAAAIIIFTRQPQSPPVNSPSASTEQATSSAVSSSSTSFAEVGSSAVQSSEQATQAEQNPAVSQSQSSAEEKKPLPAVKLTTGSSVSLGKYNGTPIEWRIIHISDDGKTAVAISDKILTMKAYDAAEGGSYNNIGSESYWRTPTEELSQDIQRSIRGDNRWERSNIRTWLNSTKEMVKYTDQPPVAKAMSEHKNGYNTEAGFLKGFSADELSVIAETKLNTGNSVTTDRVFLLSSDEIQWLYDSDVSIYAQPTEKAIENDAAGWYSANQSVYEIKEHFWWLRDADSTNACKAHIVNLSLQDNVVSTQYVGLEGYGIRPAITIDLTAPALSAIMEN